ncbi:MAG: excinuclease ABC subunit UvrA [Steroidobacteraceae bacterium]
MALIRIRGARTHNLRNIDVDLPRDALIVMTGLSGSGKSSLAFDTLYAEGQRRYVESLSAYARQFLSMMDKPDVDSIEGLSPAIAIEQKATSHNPRSTVGTVTEIYDYLRLLFARVGMPRCPDHGTDLAIQTVSQMVDQIMSLPPGCGVMVLAPLVRQRKGAHQDVFDQLRGQGLVRARIDGKVRELDELPSLDPRRKHDIDAIIDRLRIRDDAPNRLAESLETALRLADGMASIAALPGEEPRQEMLFSARHACAVCGYSVPPLEPKLFSFNNPAGACSACDGIGTVEFFDPSKVVAQPGLSLAGGAVRGWDRRNSHYFSLIDSLARHYRFDIEAPWQDLPADVQRLLLHGSDGEVIEFHYSDATGRRQRKRQPFEGIMPNLERRYRETGSSAVRDELARYRGIRACGDCGGTRLNRISRNVFVGEHNLAAITAMSIQAATQYFTSLGLSGWRQTVAERIVREVNERLRFLGNVGLDYLTLDRRADTLSGGEAQRIRLASQIGSGLTGVMYVLDEPSIGLHQRDNARLLQTLGDLRDLGNTVIVVEHDEDAIRRADHIVDLGPGAGVHGGQVVAEGPLANIIACSGSLTGDYLAGRRGIAVPARRKSRRDGHELEIRGARGNNLQALDVKLPLGLLTCVTGVSGSGKSTLIIDTLFAIAAARLNGASSQPAPCQEISGLEKLDKVIDIDQSPIGRTPRSNPATYTGLFTPVRELFAQVPEARARGYDAGRFSFNVKGGRCEACQGDGVIKVEMHFLPDVYVACDVCSGRRYNRETLEIRYRDRNIHEVLELTVQDAQTVFQNVPAIASRLATLMDVGLSYLRLGQSATTLSGGEAQRIKLAKELARRSTGRTLYILDEPTTGLHFHDVAQLLGVLHRLRDEGNTVVVIEHNLDVIKTADWVIDLGPEGGVAGGRLVGAGTPEMLVATAGSHTGTHLAPLLSAAVAKNR